MKRQPTETEIDFILVATDVLRLRYRHRRDKQVAAPSSRGGCEWVVKGRWLILRGTIRLSVFEMPGSFIQFIFLTGVNYGVQTLVDFYGFIGAWVSKWV